MQSRERGSGRALGDRRSPRPVLRLRPARVPRVRSRARPRRPARRRSPCPAVTPSPWAGTIRSSPSPPIVWPAVIARIIRSTPRRETITAMVVAMAAPSRPPRYSIGGAAPSVRRLEAGRDPGDDDERQEADREVDRAGEQRLAGVAREVAVGRLLERGGHTGHDREGEDADLQVGARAERRGDDSARSSARRPPTRPVVMGCRPAGLRPTESAARLPAVCPHTSAMLSSATPTSGAPTAPATTYIAPPSPPSRCHAAHLPERPQRARDRAGRRGRGAERHQPHGVVERGRELGRAERLRRAGR